MIAMCDTPPFFIPGLWFGDELAIWFAPDGQPMMILILTCRFDGNCTKALCAKPHKHILCFFSHKSTLCAKSHIANLCDLGHNLR